MAGVDISREMWASMDEYAFAPPPPGVVPNFTDPVLVGYHSLTIACSCCVFVLLVFSSARLYAKVGLIRKTSVDDYLFFVALLMLLLVLSLYMYLDNNGAYGYHAWDLKIKDLTRPLLVVTFIHQMLLPATVWLVKATLLFLILGIFRPITWLRLLCWVGIVTTFVFYTTNLIIQIVSCRPRGGTDRVSFLAGMASQECAASTAAIQRLSIASGIFGVISDFYILIIPLPAVIKLKIGKKQKLSVLLVFSSGALACVASIVSLIFRLRSFGTKDLTVDSIPAMATHMVEMTVGLIITCFAPAARVARHMVSHHPLRMQGDSSNANDYEGRTQHAKRKHALGQFSELKTTKTFETTSDDI